MLICEVDFNSGMSFSIWFITISRWKMFLLCKHIEDKIDTTSGDSSSRFFFDLFFCNHQRRRWDKTTHTFSNLAYGISWKVPQFPIGNTFGQSFPADMFQPKDTWKIGNSAFWFPCHFWFAARIPCRNPWDPSFPVPWSRNSTKQASMSSISDSTDTSRLRDGRMGPGSEVYMVYLPYCWWKKSQTTTGDGAKTL